MLSVHSPAASLTAGIPGIKCYNFDKLMAGQSSRLGYRRRLASLRSNWHYLNYSMVYKLVAKLEV